MPNPKDFLPPPPWEGPPIPKGIQARTLIMRMNNDIYKNLMDIINKEETVRRDLPRYLELIEPYISKDEINDLRKLLGMNPMSSDYYAACFVVKHIKDRGLQEKK